MLKKGRISAEVVAKRIGGGQGIAAVIEND
jgi:hypothetical protein